MEEFGFPPQFPAAVEETIVEEVTDSVPKDKSKGKDFIFLFVEPIIYKYVLNFR